MIFLIEYNRKEGRTVSLRTFDNSQNDEAVALRLETELDLDRRGVDNEVVLFGASSLEALRRTHRRYFATLAEMLRAGV